MRAKQPFRYAQGLQQLQDRWKAKNYRLSKTRQRKPVQTLRKMDHHSKTLQNLQQHCSRASRYRLKVCTKQTQSQSRGSGFAPKDRCAIREKALLGTFLALEKSTTRPPASGSRNEPASLPRERKDYSSSKGKRKGRSFCTVTKGTKSTEKGRRLPLPFSNPSPLTNGGKATFPVCAKFPAATG